MLDDMFSFIDPIVEPVVDPMDDDMFHSTVRLVEMYFDLMDKQGMARAKSLPEGVTLKAGMPLDIALSLLRPDELEKLRNYIAFYIAKYPQE